MIDEAGPSSGPVEGPPELVRLSRYDGASFAPVARGSVDVPVVHVLVHGWQPGLRRPSGCSRRRRPGGFVPSWDPRLGAGAGRPLVSYFQALLDAFAGLGDDHAVLWYSWADAADPEGRVRREPVAAGHADQRRRLSYALQEALGRPGRRRASARRQRLHLGRAQPRQRGRRARGRDPAVSLRRSSPARRAREPAEPRRRRGRPRSSSCCRRIRPGRGPADTFVDSYSTVFGRAYHRRLRAWRPWSTSGSASPPLTAAARLRRRVNLAHVHPLDWYAETVAAPGAGVGYGWSSLAGGGPASPARAVASSWLVRPAARPAAGAPAPAAPRRASRADVSVDDVVLRLSADTPMPGPCLHARAPGLPARVDSAPATTVRYTRSSTSTRPPAPDEAGVHARRRVDLAVDGVPAFVSAPTPAVPASGRYLLLTRPVPASIC